MTDPTPSTARARAESLFAARLAAAGHPPLSSEQLAAALRELAGAHPQLEPAFVELASQWRELHALAPLALDGGAQDAGLTRAAEALSTGACQALLARLRAGRSFAQRFELGEELGHGGMGVVRRAFDRDLRRDVAIKFVRRRPGLAPQHVADVLLRMVEEAQVTGQLEHPAIVPVHDLGLDEAGHFYFVMKLVAGRTLEAALRAAREDGAEHAGVELALDVLTRVAEAVEYAHRRGVLHRDLKPSNVMVGELGEVYVMDWGLSRSALALGGPQRAVRSELRGEDDTTPYTQEGAVLGTPPFMAPELAAGARDAAHVGSDIYALGAMLYHALAGAPPYLDDLTQPVLPRLIAGAPKPLAQIVPRAAAELIAIAERAMARASGERYASAAEFAEELKRFRDGRVVLAHRTGAWPELRKWVARNRALAATAGVALVAASAGLLAFVSERSARAVEQRAAQRFESQAALVEATRALDRGDLRTATRALPRITEPSRVWERGILAAALESDLGTRVHADASGAREAVRSIGLRAGGDEVVVVGLEGAVRSEGLEREPSNAVALGLGGRVERAMLHPGGDLLLVALKDESLSLWSLASRSKLRELEPPQAAERASFGALALSTDGELGAAASRDGQVFTFDLERGARVQRWRASERVIPSIAFDASSGVLLCAQLDGLISAWDPRSGERAFELGRRDMNPLITLAASSDGARLLSGGLDGATNLWDLRERRLVQRWFTGSARVLCAAISPDGSRGASASDDGSVMLFDLVGGRELGRIAAHEGLVFALAFSAGGELVVSAGDDGRTRVWDALDVGVSQALRGHVYTVAAAAWSPAGQTLATSGDDNSLRLWERATRRALGVGAMHTNPVWRVTWTPDGAHVITASADRTIGVWRPEGPTLVARLEGHEHDVRDVEVSPDGATLYSVSSDKNLRRWRTRDWTALDATDLGRDLQALAIDPRGVWLAVGSLDGAVELLDAANPRKSLWRIEAAPANPSAPPPAVQPGSPTVVLAAERVRGHGGAITALSFSPGGERLASTSRDGRALVWNLAQRSCEFELVGHKGEVVDVAFHPAGQTLVTAGTDNIGLVWSLETGALTLRLIGHTSQLTGCAFSPDGQVLATTSVDRTARLWDARPSREIRAARAFERERRARLAPQLEELYARLGTTPRVLEELERDLARPQAERDSLADMARTQGDDPLAILELVDEPLFDPAATREQLELALVRTRRSRELNAFHRETPLILAQLLLRMPGGTDAERRSRGQEAWMLLEAPELSALAEHKDAALRLRYYGCRALAALALGEQVRARAERESFDAVWSAHAGQLRTELRRFAEWVRTSMDG